MAKKKQAKKNGISLLLLISISFVFIGLLFFKILSLTGDSITPICAGGSTLVKFHVNGSKTAAASDGSLNKVRITLQPEGKNCMYVAKTNKNGYAEFPKVIPGNYKLTADQKDINKGKSLCDKHTAKLEILKNSDYSIIMGNCNNHAFNI